ncbi:MAG: hypothetical protein KAT00_00155 [Planctomycetes bacterium]|nr:hypothetical protein [Planctomycetota bacterium]
MKAEVEKVSDHQVYEVVLPGTGTITPTIVRTDPHGPFYLFDEYNGDRYSAKDLRAIADAVDELNK